MNQHFWYIIQFQPGDIQGSIFKNEVGENVIFHDRNEAIAYSEALRKFETDGFSHVIIRDDSCAKGHCECCLNTECYIRSK